jgi:hypothetical protein
MNPLDTNGGLKNHGGSEITQVLTHLGLVLPIQRMSGWLALRLYEQGGTNRDGW